MKRLLPFATFAVAACATMPPVSASPTAGLGQVAQVDGLQIRPLQILEDSRCPINVVCVWAGRLVVRTEIRGGNWRETRDLELRKPQSVADGQLTLIEAAPSKLADQPAKPADYRFTFAFEGGL